MLIIRPIKESDLPALMMCAESSGHGFTSLPVDEKMLTGRIEHSVESFARNVSSAVNEEYLMVAEDTQTGNVVGTTAIDAAVGVETPFYTYQISKQIHYSSKFNVRNEVEILTLTNNYTGATEICTLFLQPEYRYGLNGKLLSKSRFLMLAQFPEKFSEVVFAEMRGVSDHNGNSPFWHWLETHFFSMPFTQADYLTGVGKKGFIAELMPQLPIYVNLLDEKARNVIGKVHKSTKPALKLLEKEGFSCRGYIDIFDGGPTVECLRHNIRSVRDAFTASVKVAKHGKGQSYFIANTSFQHFRATVTKVLLNDTRDQAIISPDVAEALSVGEGDIIRLIRAS